jgi:excisionase family DNA binding protein
MAQEVILSARLLRTKEVATMLNFDVATVQRRVRAGQLRCIRLGPNTLRFTLEDVQAFIEKGRGQ